MSMMMGGANAGGGRITPPATANFALVMLASTARGDAYTFAEFQAIFAQAGFVRSAFHSLPPTTQQAVVSYKDVLLAEGSEAALGQHVLWGSILVFLITYGPGKLSLDYLLNRSRA